MLVNFEGSEPHNVCSSARSGEPVGAEPVQDRAVEAAHLGELGIGVQRVPVAAEAVRERLVGPRLVGDDLVGVAVGRHVRGPDGPRSPPKPPSPRMNIELRVVNMGSPVAASTESASFTTTAAEPLS